MGVAGIHFLKVHTSSSMSNHETTLHLYRYFVSTAQETHVAFALVTTAAIYQNVKS